MLRTFAATAGAVALALTSLVACTAEACAASAGVIAVPAGGTVALGAADGLGAARHADKPRKKKRDGDCD